jgi:hypothetical protein
VRIRLVPETQAEEFQENAMSPLPLADRPRAIAVWTGKIIAIPVTHQRVGACIIITDTTILHTGYSTGSRGRTAAVPFAIHGARALRSVSSGRIIIVNSSLLAYAATGPTTITDAITGMDGTLIHGMDITLRDM